MPDASEKRNGSNKSITSSDKKATKPKQTQPRLIKTSLLKLIKKERIQSISQSSQSFARNITNAMNRLYQSLKFKPVPKTEKRINQLKIRHQALQAKFYKVNSIPEFLACKQELTNLQNQMTQLQTQSEHPLFQKEFKALSSLQTKIESLDTLIKALQSTIDEANKPRDFKKLKHNETLIGNTIKSYSDHTHPVIQSYLSYLRVVQQNLKKTITQLEEMSWLRQTVNDGCGLIERAESTKNLHDLEKVKQQIDDFLISSLPFKPKIIQQIWLELSIVKSEVQWKILALKIDHFNKLIDNPEQLIKEGEALLQEIQRLKKLAPVSKDDRATYERMQEHILTVGKYKRLFNLEHSLALDVHRIPKFIKNSENLKKCIHRMDISPSAQKALIEKVDNHVELLKTSEMIRICNAKMLQKNLKDYAVPSILEFVNMHIMLLQNLQKSTSSIPVKNKYHGMEVHLMTCLQVFNLSRQLKDHPRSYAHHKAEINRLKNEIDHNIAPHVRHYFHDLLSPRKKIGLAA